MNDLVRSAALTFLHIVNGVLFFSFISYLRFYTVDLPLEIPEILGFIFITAFGAVLSEIILPQRYDPHKASLNKKTGDTE